MEGTPKRSFGERFFDLFPPVFILILFIGLQAIYSRYSESIYLNLVYNGGWPLTVVGRFLFDYGLYFTAFLFSILLVCFAFRIKWKELGFRKVSFLSLIKWGLMGGLLILTGVVVAGLVIQNFVHDMKPQQVEEVFQQVKGVGELLVMLLVSAVLAPFIEEMFFRGILYGTLRKYIGVTWAIVVSGFIFGGMHADLVRLIPLTLGGMALAYIYERADSIYASWLAHGVWNGFMSLAVYFSMIAS